MKRAKVEPIYDIKYFRANLGALIEALAPGEWFIVTVNGEPRVKVVRLTDREKEKLHSPKTSGER